MQIGAWRSQGGSRLVPLSHDRRNPLGLHAGSGQCVAPRGEVLVMWTRAGNLQPGTTRMPSKLVTHPSPDSVTTKPDQK